MPEDSYESRKRPQSYSSGSPSMSTSETLGPTPKRLYRKPLASTNSRASLSDNKRGRSSEAAHSSLIYEHLARCVETLDSAASSAKHIRQLIRKIDRWQDKSEDISPIWAELCRLEKNATMRQNELKDALHHARETAKYDESYRPKRESTSSPLVKINVVVNGVDRRMEVVPGGAVKIQIEGNITKRVISVEEAADRAFE